jgi:hypothetical protein
MSNGSGVWRGDRNRNARLAGLRELVPLGNAVVGIDMADKKQMVVVCDHDSKVLGMLDVPLSRLGPRRRVGLGRRTRGGGGWAGVAVACEPTGQRWRVLGQLAADRKMPFVWVQPMLTSWSRRSEDLTIDKTDEKDAVLIARLTAQLRCYVPEPVDETWGRLRHLGARRGQLICEAVSQIQQMRDLLECVWPAGLDGGALQGLDHHGLHDLVVDRAGRTRAGCIGQPSNRSAANRCRHLATVTRSQPSSPAMARLVLPSAHANTIRDRSANACEEECRRVHRRSVIRSSSLSSISTVGRPARPITGSFCRGPLPLQNRWQPTKFPIPEDLLADQPDRTLVCRVMNSWDKS